MSWTSKPKRNGNDELPTDRVAVKIIRNSKTMESPRNQLPSNSPTKQPVTKISKLVYEPKRQPTPGVVKSIHSYRVAQTTSDAASEKRRPSIRQKDSMSAVPTANPELQASFVDKRLERQKNMLEIQEILKGIADNKQGVQSIVDPSEEVKAPHIPVENTASIPSNNLNSMNSSTTKRSKTDPEMIIGDRTQHITSRSNQRSNDRQSARSKSSVNPKSNRTAASNATSTAKQKAYDPEIARKYIEEQKERRKLVAAAAKNAVGTVDRDEIKKRLENLRKSTRTILQKNVKKVRKISIDSKSSIVLAEDVKPTQNNVECGTPTEDQQLVEVQQPSAVNFAALPKKVPSGKSAGKPKETLNTKHIEKQFSTKTKPLQSCDSNKTDHSSKDFKKIGLLRKPDGDAGSQLDAINTLDFLIDKENIAEMPLTAPPHSKPPSPNLSGKAMNAAVAEPQPNVVEKPPVDLTLNIPDVKLKPKSRVSVAEKSTQAEQPLPTKPALPYWLQPTPVQLYPYNFIKAVRKKLEAITNPTLSAKDQQTKTVQTSITDLPHKYVSSSSLSRPVAAATAARQRLLSRPDLNEVSSINIEKCPPGHNLSTASSVFTPFLISPAHSPKKSSSVSMRDSAKPPPTPPPPLHQDQYKSMSEVTSSITVNLPPSNTVSEVSSIHSEVIKNPMFSSTQISRRSLRVQKNDEDTTASSSVFSSPEKRISVPSNHLRKISTAEGKKQSIVPFVLPENVEEQEKPHAISPLSIDRVKNLTLKSKSSASSQTDVKSRQDFEKMLVDFNKSLSHVIEVNQQLQSALSKSPHSIPSRSTEESIRTVRSDASNGTKSSSSPSKISESYTTDFEKSSSHLTYNKDTSSDKATATSNRIKNSNETESKESIKTINREPHSTSDSDQPLSATQKRIVESPVQKTVTSSASPYKATDETIKNVSNDTEEFIDSIEDGSRTFVKFISSPNRQSLPQDSNNFSKDSLEIPMENENRIHSFSNQEIIRNQINVSRGDKYDMQPNRQLDIFSNNNVRETQPIRLSDDSFSHRPVLNSSIGSDIFAIFNHSEMELSIISHSSRLSESNLNYSTLGLYEQLIRTEATKTEHLSALLKVREKSILDRTRGQIALLEIQKEKCRAKGLTSQISIIKRKQRAILMKMEKEREEIKRILKLSEKDPTDRKRHATTSIQLLKLPDLPPLDISLRQNMKSIDSPANKMLRGLELNSSQNLEMLLLEREKELERRRNHVERLLKWHQRLDQEEEEVLRIEEMLYKHNQKKSIHLAGLENSSDVVNTKKQQQLMDIDKSLRELQSITTTNSGSETRMGKDVQSDYVRSSGQKLNRLWRRLTGRKEMRFDQAKRYKLTKCDLEKLYEDAKSAVLADFQSKDLMELLTDQSFPQQANNSSQDLNLNSNVSLKERDIPHLNLDFSSGASDFEQLLPSESVNDATFSKVENGNEGNRVEESSFSDDFIHDENVKTSDTEYTTNFTSSQNSSAGKLYSSTTPTTINTANMNSDLNASIKSSESECHSSNKKTVDASIDAVLTDDEEEMAVANSVSNESDANKPETQDILEESPSQRIDPIFASSSSARETSVKLISSEDSSHNRMLNEIMPAIACHDDYIDQTNETDTLITDISEPKFESTLDELVDEEHTIYEADKDSSSNPSISNGSRDHDSLQHQESLILAITTDTQHPAARLEKRLNDLEQSLIELNNSFERVLSPESNTASSQTSIGTDISNNIAIEDEKIDDHSKELSPSKMTVKDFLLNAETTSSLMPDIINEVELRRRQQVLVESDIIQLEHAVPYALLREIPNKPPPPYVPPAHGSPMTTIFPSESRIKEITFRRTKELYEEANGTEAEISCGQRTSILDENITNIYERIILDICRECFHDYQPTFTASSVVVGNYKMPLALYNPPNRLKCIQEFVYKRVRKLLNMDKRRPRPNSIFSLGRRKRDHVDEILIQELYEEEHKWSNFDLEEDEVKDSVVDEVFQELIKDIIDDFEDNYNRKVLGKSNNYLRACENDICSQGVNNENDLCRE